ncbi:MAG: FAD-dependent oxidoreductase [Acidimicrobiia bacterium]|nr:FAD-dependent oxidoreductase [Acidimicrobiia bacterium]
MTRVVVLGAGIGGASVVEHLTRGRAARLGVDVTVVDPRRVGIVRPLLPFVAAGVLAPGAAAVDLRRIGRHARLVCAEAVRVDTAAKRVTVRDPLTRGESELPYDQLVVALGGAAHDSGVPGIIPHAICVRTVADALLLQRRVAEAAAARLRLPVAVIGAELAGISIASLLSRAQPHTAVTLLDRKPWPLPSFGRDLGTAAEVALAGSAVTWRPGSAVAEIGSDSLLLRDGTELPSSVVVWTAGHRSAPAAESAFPGAELTAGRRLVTDPMLRVRGLADVWACGDCASVPWLDVGGDCPPAGVFARTQGARVAVNIARVLRGEYPRSFRRDIPILVPAGPHTAVGTFRGLHLSGVPGAYAWAASLGCVRQRYGPAHGTDPGPDDPTTVLPVPGRTVPVFRAGSG